MSSSLVAYVPPTAFWEFNPWCRYPIESRLHKFCICPLKHVFNCYKGLVTDTVYCVTASPYHVGTKMPLGALHTVLGMEVIITRSQSNLRQQHKQTPLFSQQCHWNHFFFKHLGIIYSYYSSTKCIIIYLYLLQDYGASYSPEQHVTLQFLFHNKHALCLFWCMPICLTAARHIGIHQTRCTVYKRLLLMMD